MGLIWIAADIALRALATFCRLRSACKLLLARSFVAWSAAILLCSGVGGLLGVISLIRMQVFIEITARTLFVGNLYKTRG